MAGQVAGDRVPVAGRHRARSRQRCAGPGQAAWRSAVPGRIAGGGADPVRGQPDLALPRIAGHRSGRARAGQLWRGGHLAAAGLGCTCRGRTELADSHAVRCVGLRDRPDGDRADAAYPAAERAHRQHAALGRHRDRPAGRVVRGADLRGDRVAAGRSYHRHLRRHDRLRRADRCAECMADRLPAAPAADSRIPAELRRVGRGATRLQRLQ